MHLKTVMGVVVASLALAAGSNAATPYQDIASSGPLEHVYLGNELSCQVDHTADTLLQFYPPSVIPGDCGTFLAVGTTLYAPDFLNHGGTATGSLGARTPFTPVSQSGVTGSGTGGDPYRVATTVDVGTTGLRIDEVDTYVVGNETYRTQITISNSTGVGVDTILYRAGDCFLAGSDFGYGFTQVSGTRKAVGCSVNADNTPPGRIEEWVPLTGGNNFYQAFYAEVWSWIGTETTFPDTCECTLLQDNGAGISWVLTVPALGSVVFIHDTVFSPTGKEPLTTDKTADSPSSAPGAQNGYTITVSNPNPDPVTLNSITDDLPAGFTYVPGSTTGVTTNDPGIVGQTLTWSGPFIVPAAGSVSLHFNVQVSTVPGDYYNRAGADAADGYTVLPTGDTALITVVAAPPNLCGSSPNPPCVIEIRPRSMAVNEPVGADLCVGLTINILQGLVSDGTAGVTYRTVNGTAKALHDYDAETASVTFPSGTNFVPLDICINDDSFTEARESFSVGLFQPVNASIEAAGQKTTIFINSNTS